MYHWPIDLGYQVSVVFPKNITVLGFFRVILVHNKIFLSIFYQLKDSTPKKTCPVCDRSCPVHLAIYAGVLIQSKKIPCKYQKNIKEAILNLKTKS